MSAQDQMQTKDRFEFAAKKPRRQIFSDNLIGGLAWGIGSVIGATIIVGIFGLLIARSKNIPLVGDVVQVIVDEINQGRNFDLFGTKSNTTAPTTTNPTNTNNSNSITPNQPTTSYTVGQ